MVSQATEKICLSGKTSGKICISCWLALFVALYFSFVNSAMQVCQHGTIWGIQMHAGFCYNCKITTHYKMWNIVNLWPRCRILPSCIRPVVCGYLICEHQFAWVFIVPHIKFVFCNRLDNFRAKCSWLLVYFIVILSIIWVLVLVFIARCPQNFLLGHISGFPPFSWVNVRLSVHG